MFNFKAADAALLAIVLARPFPSLRLYPGNVCDLYVQYVPRPPPALLAAALAVRHCSLRACISTPPTALHLYAPPQYATPRRAMQRN